MLPFNKNINVKENAITRSCITEKLSSRKLRLFALYEKVIAFQA